MSARSRSTERPARPLPAVDERLIMPETRHEVIDGEVVYVSPADQPHGSRHSKLQALLEAYAADGYDAACDMLTRTSEKDDIAPDGSIYPSRPDPTTGGRQLEELAFQVMSKESKAAAGAKAARLIERGVRRVFAIDVERQRALEWSRRTGGWQILPGDGAIDDRALALPLPIRDLVVAAKSDDAVARALLAKGNPVLVEALTLAQAEGKAEGKAEGNAEGKALAVLAVLRGRGLTISTEAERVISQTRDSTRLDDWLARAGTCRTAEELIRGRRRR